MGVYEAENAQVECHNLWQQYILSFSFIREG
jgi:lipase chaperone LimK